MKPPEKIYIRFDKEPTVCTFGDAKWDKEPLPFQKGLEYHLAPVWLDAVKEPPKEVDYYIVSQYLKTLGCWAKPIIAEWDGHPEWWAERGYTHWMPLPLPPERSGK
jgi:hypothetical protein